MRRTIDRRTVARTLSLVGLLALGGALGANAPSLREGFAYLG